MKRKSLRKKVQSVLKAANIAGIGQDVYCRKSTNHEESQLPFICIYPNDETAQRYDEAPKRYKRNYEIVIEVISTHDSDELLCDELDDLADAIEKTIESSRSLQGWDPYDDLGNQVEDCEATSVNYDIQADGSNPMGAVRLTYSINYIDEPDKPTVTDDFVTVETEWKIGDHGENKAVDKVVIP